MLCVWMQDNANIVKISKVLEELPEFFFFWVKWQVSMEHNQVKRKVRY
jgi:hypothetical protein